MQTNQVKLFLIAFDLLLKRNICRVEFVERCRRGLIYFELFGLLVERNQ